MKRITFLLLFAASSLTVFAQTAWTADKAHTQIKFDVTHMGISTVSGSFVDFDADINTSKEDFSDATFQFTAKTASINTGIEQRDKHLKSADFFDAEQFPEVSFKSTGLEKISDGKYTLAGDLTFHGVTKPVLLDLWYRGTVTNPMNQKKVAGFRVSGNVNRADFDLGAKFPVEVLSEEIQIIADGEFSPAQ